LAVLSPGAAGSTASSPPASGARADASPLHFHQVLTIPPPVAL
jgi:hypothetical protein